MLPLFPRLIVPLLPVAVADLGIDGRLHRQLAARGWNATAAIAPRPFGEVADAVGWDEANELRKAAEARIELERDHGPVDGTPVVPPEYDVAIPSSAFEVVHVPSELILTAGEIAGLGISLLSRTLRLDGLGMFELALGVDGAVLQLMGLRLEGAVHNMRNPTAGLTDGERSEVSTCACQQVRNILGRLLSERQASVLTLRWGLRQEGPATLREVGDLEDVTRERIRQIQKAGERQLHRRRPRASLCEFIARAIEAEDGLVSEARLMSQLGIHVQDLYASAALGRLGLIPRIWRADFDVPFWTSSRSAEQNLSDTHRLVRKFLRQTRTRSAPIIRLIAQMRDAHVSTSEHVLRDLLDSDENIVATDHETYALGSRPDAVARILVKVLHLSGPMRMQGLVLAIGRVRAQKRLADVAVPRELASRSWFAQEDGVWKLTSAAPPPRYTPAEAAAARILARRRCLTRGALLETLVEWGVGRARAQQTVSRSPVLTRWPTRVYTLVNHRPTSEDVRAALLGEANA